MCQESGTSDVGADIVVEAQVHNGQTVNMVAVLARRSVQVHVPVESRADISAHRFWKRGATAMYDIRIFILDAGSYLRMTPEKSLAKA